MNKYNTIKTFLGYPYTKLYFFGAVFVFLTRQ